MLTRYLPFITLACFTWCACVQKMGKGGHLRPLEDPSAYSIISRVPPLGTIPQDNRSEGSIQIHPPHRDTKVLLEKGREQFNIYCMPCHGMSGFGDGMIVQRGFLAPPSYHIDRLRGVPDQHIFEVITHGFGAMYSYADRVSVSNRWAIIRYIRALQLSQNTRYDELPVKDQHQLNVISPSQNSRSEP